MFKEAGFGFGGSLNPFLQSTLLGVVEGLTEFLPVSSTAHLRITEAFMHIPLKDAFWEMYSIVIQIGAILALLLLYLERIVRFLRTFPRGEGGDRTWLNHPIALTLIAFACTSAPALLLRKWSEKNLDSLKAMAWALIVGGIVMWAVDVWSDRQDPETRDVEEMSLLQSIWVGLCQTFSAVFPGVSRSMSTIAAGQTAGMTRPAALEFSFLLSIPTMIAATGWDFVKEVHGKVGAAGIASGQVVMNPERWGVLLLGTVVSFIVAYGVVEWFLFWVRRHGFVPFAVYRILLGGWLLFWGAKYIGG